MTCRKRLLFSIFGIFVVTFMAIALVWVRTETIRLGYECARISRDIETAMRVQKKLRLEWERITAYSELERIAREEFGLAPPDPSEIEFLVDDADAAGR
ncbi:cell division protein FtsL [Thermodesulforhabdus norvegica]|uniref:Cell division protein FtsL n=1 Tax=Thermodesulforhabdus norvegica TaxID=39841 RepID=A0A1I4QG60_9BACT|nr:cell division protein FtsL [Thermodesulforhabdus norvegica]SFM39102.1 cell division protein FtsL [Thermodesulforhabdus norvegica]